MRHPTSPCRYNSSVTGVRTSARMTSNPAAWKFRARLQAFSTPSRCCAKPSEPCHGAAPPDTTSRRTSSISTRFDWYLDRLVHLERSGTLTVNHEVVRATSDLDSDCYMRHIQGCCHLRSPSSVGRATAPSSSPERVSAHRQERAQRGRSGIRSRVVRGSAWTRIGRVCLGSTDAEAHFDSKDSRSPLGWPSWRGTRAPGRMVWLARLCR
jgi:hypothetical protein